MTYDKNHPYRSQILERYPLTSPASGKLTVHVVLDLEGFNQTYAPGDSFGVFPFNSSDLIEKTKKQLAPIEGPILFKGESIDPEQFLKEFADLSRCNKKLFQKLTHNEMDKDELKSYLSQRFVWDLLKDFPDVKLTLQDLADCLFPLLPRFYSIASSQQVTPKAVDLTVALTEYVTNNQQRYGACSHYLCETAPLHSPEVKIYLQPTKEFLLPEDDSRPIIMVGPGTGIAPFRAFMQEREKRGAKGKNWLFFGEWREKNDYFYREEWKRWIDRGLLRMETAFSRDQEHKIYVQDRMRENAAELLSWLNAGAILYVCGDALKMAKDVDLALHEIIAEQGGLDAKAYVKQMRLERRYLRDVY